jgi:hypothetical protein
MVIFRLIQAKLKTSASQIQRLELYSNRLSILVFNLPNFISSFCVRLKQIRLAVDSTPLPIREFASSSFGKFEKRKHFTLENI